MDQPASPQRAFGSEGDAPGERAGAFRPGELAVVLAQYDLGVVRSVAPFTRGARAAPKVLVASDRGRYLLKRLRPGTDDPLRVGAVQGLQHRLRERGFPLPALVASKNNGGTMLRLDGAVYELFEYIEGVGYDGGEPMTGEAGAWLAVFHRLAPEGTMEWRPPLGGYHASRRVLASLQAARTQDKAGAIAAALEQLYNLAATRCEKLGARRWPAQLIHGDWHAGNMLFAEDGRVSAVVDYDAVRLAPRVLDVAQGLAQFSIRAPGRDVTAAARPEEAWAADLDAGRLRWFWAGYDRAAPTRAGGPGRLSKSERRALPWLMIESLISEAVEPVARTGRFLRVSGPAFLRMIHDKAVWIADRADSDLRRVFKGRA
ncbi:MAG: phosphotransferase [Planctomycetota bacterium]